MFYYKMFFLSLFTVSCAAQVPKTEKIEVPANATKVLTCFERSIWKILPNEDIEYTGRISVTGNDGSNREYYKLYKKGDSYYNEVTKWLVDKEPNFYDEKIYVTDLQYEC